MLKKTRNEKGAIVVEATLSLSVYIILIFMILSIIDMANTQSKVKVTMNNIAKEMSQFAYGYHAAGLDNAEKNLLKGHEKVDKTIDDVKGAFDKLKDTISSAQEGDIGGAIDSGGGAVDNIESALDTDADLGDGVAWIFGKAGSLAKKELIGKYARHYMRRNLKDFRDDTYEAFQKRHHLLNEIDFNGSEFVTNGSNTAIILKMEYEIELFDFFKLNFKVKINEAAQTKAWLGGIPVKEQ